MSTLDHEGTVQVLKRVLVATTPLPGAACIGQPALFDPAGDREHRPQTIRRHEAAVRICDFVCPVRVECAAWLAGLTPRQRPAGVVAGRRPNLPAVGRPPKGITL